MSAAAREHLGRLDAAAAELRALVPRFRRLRPQVRARVEAELALAAGRLEQLHAAVVDVLCDKARRQE